MQKKRYETIIVGAGIAGLACARTLHKNKRKFKIIAENVAGRILVSKDGKVNYGAYYVGEEFNHVLKFVRKKRRIDILDVVFFKKGKLYSLLSRKVLFHPVQMLNLYLLLKKFKKEYTGFKKQTEHTSQKEAIESDPYLLRLYRTKAADFVKEQSIKNIAEDYLEPIMHGTTFSSLNEMNAFGFLQFLMPFIVPIYEFVFLKDKMIAPFKTAITRDSVTAINKQKSGYVIKTKKGKKYCAKTVVVATPIEVSKKLLKLKRINKPIKANMFHLKGRIKEKWNEGEIILFDAKCPILAIARQEDGTYLVYSKKTKPYFKKYFEKYKVITEKFWDPAFNTNGKILLECKQGKNLYMAGDYNVCGLEDAFITGIYAANRVMNAK